MKMQGKGGVSLPNTRKSIIPCKYKMRKFFSLSFILLCILTLIEIDYASFGIMDILILFSMASSLVSYLMLYIVKKGEK